MKTFKILFASITLSLVFAFSANAQIIDSFPWFKAPGSIMTPKILDGKGTYTIPNPRMAVAKTQSIQVASQTISLPSSIKVLNAPLTLKNGDQCIEVYCAQTKECSDCVMLWKDINGDKKIQPRRELRCVCKGGSDNCGIKARPVDCK